MGLSTKQILAYEGAAMTGRGFSNVTAEEQMAAQDGCEAIYELKGAEAFNDCVDAALSKKDSTDWKTVLNNAFSFGSKIIDQNNKPSGNSSNYNYVEPKKTNPAVYVIGGLAVVGAIYGIYKMTSK